MDGPPAVLRSSSSAVALAQFVTWCNCARWSQEVGRSPRPLGGGKPLEVFMKPVSRYGVSKGRSANKFKHNVSRTRALNLRPPPMRGGFRI